MYNFKDSYGNIESDNFYPLLECRIPTYGRPMVLLGVKIWA